jgi:hypothetical protein
MKRKFKKKEVQNSKNEIRRGKLQKTNPKFQRGNTKFEKIPNFQSQRREFCIP